MAYLDNTIPADSEQVSLGASRIRDLKTALNTIIATIWDNTGAFIANWITSAMFAPGAVNTAAIGDQQATPQKVANAIAGNGLIKAVNTDPISVNVDNSTIGFDTSTPPKLKALSISPLNASVVASSRNLVITNNGSGSLITITADEVVLKNASGIPLLVSNVNVTLNRSASGVNGFDGGGTFSAGNFYEIYLISNGTTTASLFCFETNTPILPAGYTYKALVGVVWSQFVINSWENFYQLDRDIWIAPNPVFTSKAAQAANTYELYQFGTGSDTALNLIVPQRTKRIRGNAGDASTGAASLIEVASDANGTGAVVIAGSNAGVTLDGFALGGRFDIPLIGQQLFYWRSNNTNAHNSLVITGYSI